MKDKIINKIKGSIAIKMSLLLSVVIIASLSIILLFSNVLLPRYYGYSKQKSIKQLYYKLQAITKIDSNIDQSKNTDALNELCDKDGATIIVVNADGSHIYEYGNERMLKERWKEIISRDSISSIVKADVIEQNSNYVLQSVTDVVSNKNHYELYGKLNSDNFFVIRMSVENIRENAHISNRFFIMIALVILIMTLFVMNFVTKRYAKPILELADISKRMSDLDFEAKYNGDSNDEIGTLGNNMNDMSDKLEKTIAKLKNANIKLSEDIEKRDEIDKMKADFISNVSHDLKTPIALINGYAEGLQDGIADNPQDLNYYCDVIKDEANKMNKMVKNLLALNQLEYGSNSLEIERFNVTELISNLLKNMSIEAKKLDVTVEFDDSKKVYVWADEFQIEQVLVNYIQNAFNHVTKGGLIRVLIVTDVDVAKIIVYNQGMNIPKEDIDHIWDKFYKVDKARTRKYGGNGIGLSIVKVIMDRHNKKYGVLNLEDGVEFYIELDTNSKTGEENDSDY